MNASRRNTPYRKRAARKKTRYYHRGKRCSRGEKTIASCLDKLGVDYEMEAVFEGCRSPLNRPLRFDFYLPAYNMCIEFQGQHHYNPINKHRSAQISHAKTVRHDKIKKTFTFNNGLWLVEIPHWVIDDIYTGLPLLLANATIHK
jgi:hypothetical protein